MVLQCIKERKRKKEMEPERYDSKLRSRSHTVGRTMRVAVMEKI